MAESTPLLPATVTNGISFGSTGNQDAEQACHDSTWPRGAHSDVVPTWGEMMKYLKPYLKPIDMRHSSLAVFALVSVMGGKVLNVLPPLAIKYAVDVLTTVHKDSTDNGKVGFGTTFSESLGFAKHQIVMAISVYFGLKVATLLNSAVQDLAQRTVALDAERRFGVALFGHLHKLSLSYHLEKHIGEVTRIMNRGVDAISTVISSFLFYVVPTLFEAIVVSAVFWKLGTPSIALSTVLAVIVYLWFTVAITQTRISYRRKLIEASDAVGQKETETLVNYETVSMFGRTNHEVKLYAELRQIYKTRRVNMLGMFATLESGQTFIRLCGVAGGLILAGYAAIKEPDFTAGSFVIIQMYIDQLFQPLTMLGWQYRMITQAFTDLEKAVTMLMRVPDVQDEPGAIVWNPKSKSGDIVFQNVTFRYKVDGARQSCLGGLAKDDLLNGGMGGGGGRHGGRRGRMALGYVDEGVSKKNATDEETPAKKVQLGGVCNINFSVPGGKTTALVGASGSGKTTLVRLVLRMYDTDVGNVLVDGQNVRRLTQESLRSNIGVVAQDTILFNASLRENIVYGKADATEEEVWAAVRAAALEEFVQGLPQKLETVVGERGMKLSGGERQRVGMARCIIKDPSIILLDEATSALDSATERDIQQNIRRVCKGRTTIMIAHRLSTARQADEIVVLNKGEIVERGTHAQLLELPNGHYAKMWQIQSSSEGNLI